MNYSGCPSNLLLGIGKTQNLVFSGIGGCIFAFPADMDSDGDQDVLSSFAGWYDYPLMWFENEGQGTGWHIHYIEGDYPRVWCAYPGDLDYDGDMDVVGSNHASANTRLEWWRNEDGVGDTWTRFTIEEGVLSDFVCFADMDGDSNLDVVAQDRYADQLAWWESTTWPPDSQWVRHVVADGARNYELFVVDFDRDDDMDILYPDYDVGLVLFENLDGAGTAWEEHTISTRYTWTSAHAADIDGDGDYDVAACNSENHPYPGLGLYWYENLDGQGESWEEHVVAYEVQEPKAVHAEDFTNDGYIDIAFIQHVSPNGPYLYENLDGSGEQWAEHILGGLGLGYDADAADFDEDGLTDLLAVGYTSIYWYSISRFDYGWLESSILDIGGYPQWDSLTWEASLFPSADMYFRVRSSNDPEELGAWSDPIQSQGSLAGYMDSTHRFMQYRVYMDSPSHSSTPILDSITFYYSSLGLEEEESSFFLQVVPNPSAGSATVRFELFEEMHVELGIYDLAGRLVRVPAEGPHCTGLHEIVVSDLPSGVYVARMRAGDQFASERFAVVR
jgi:hypothetical protein